MTVSARTAIFSKLVRDFMRPVAVRVPRGTALEAVVGRMRDAATACALVTDTDGRVAGILTEQDVTRRVTFCHGADEPVDTVMSAPAFTIGRDEYLYHAIAAMRRRRLRHLPAVDDDGMPVGLLDLHEALAVTAEDVVAQIDRLTHDASLEGMRAVKAAQVDLAADLFAEHLPAPEIQALITHVNNDIYRRLTGQIVADMKRQGWGEPPVNFAVIVMGSGGRGENYLFPDQDNGLILEDYPNDQHNQVDGWFRAFSERLTRALDDVGFPLCRGYCMAVNPLWRKTLSQWTAQVSQWTRRRSTVAIRLADIFFDFRCVYGDTALAGALRRHVTAQVRRNPAFLHGMFAEEADHNVALGLFGRFQTESEKEDFKGWINLKHTGTIPLVEAARLLALREGIPATGTLSRLNALRGKEVLSREEHTALTDAFHVLTDLLLRRQIDDFRNDRPVSTHVPPDSLTHRERGRLRDALKAIDSLRKRIRMEFTGHVF